MPSANIPAVKDNAYSTLSAGISASTLSIPLATGEGTRFPQPYNGTATSLGSSILLNCTGISATIGGSAAVGKPIFNATDGSIAFIKSVATHAVTTTPLLGGSDNTWQNSDTWRIDEFVATFEKVTTSAYGVDTVTQREEALIIARSTDTLTVLSGARGYNSTTANTFDSGDHVRLLVTSPNHDRIKDYQYELAKLTETLTNNDSTIRSNADFYALTTGSSNAYAATYSNLPTITTGLRVFAKANHLNTGASTFNYNSGGAVAIKKLGGSTDIASGDIPSGMIMELEYDGTYWQMLTPPGAAPTVSATGEVFFGDGSDGDVVISGNTTLTRDMFYDDLTVNTGITLSTGGYRIFVAGTLTLTGTGKISGSGAAGSNGDGGTNQNTYPGGGGGASADGYVLGTVGVAGANSNTVGGSTGTAGTNVTQAFGSNGVAGGAGGAGTGGAGGAAGAAGTVTATAATSGGYRNVMNLVLMRLLLSAASPVAFRLHAGSSGGGSGGGGGGGGEGGGSGGGSGANGYNVLVAAKTITGSGNIESKGGAGGIGGNSSTNSSGNIGGGGGGGGGSGGIAALIYQGKTGWSGSIDVSGGTGGTGGTNRGSGVAGSNGTNGNAGVAIQLKA